MGENTSCSAYLGVHVAERVLSHVFKDVEKMPRNNPGFDFICNRGKKIDVKSSCRRHHEKQADNWLFSIKRNRIADHFLCLAFNNRESLNPEHIWLIPSEDVNHLTGASITVTRLDKWARYEQPLDKIVKCCEAIR